MTGGRVGETIAAALCCWPQNRLDLLRENSKANAKQATHEALNTRHPTGGREEFDRVR